MNSIYVAYFWKNVNFEMLEDIKDYSIEEIKDYILQMGEYFYELEKQSKGDNIRESIFSFNSLFYTYGGR